MNQISLYLAKYKNLGLENRLVTEKVLEILKNDFGLNVESNQISFKDMVLNVKITGPLKTEIVLKKEKIIDSLNRELEKLNLVIKKIN